MTIDEVDFEVLRQDSEEIVDFVLDAGAFPPEKFHKADAGYDLRTPYDFTIAPGEYRIIDTGVHMGIPFGFYGKLESKSGLMTKKAVVSHGGVIDSGYTGSIQVMLTNHGHNIYEAKAGDKIIQIIIQPCINAYMRQVDSLGETERGSQGFGSTGR